MAVLDEWSCEDMCAFKPIVGVLDARARTVTMPSRLVTAAVEVDALEAAAKVDRRLRLGMMIANRKCQPD